MTLVPALQQTGQMAGQCTAQTEGSTKHMGRLVWWQTCPTKRGGGTGVGFDGCVRTSFLSPLRVCGLEPCPCLCLGILVSLAYSWCLMWFSWRLGAPVYLNGWPAVAYNALESRKAHGRLGSGMGKACSGLEILTALNCLGNQQARDLAIKPISRGWGTVGTGLPADADHQTTPANRDDSEALASALSLEYEQGN